MSRSALNQEELLPHLLWVAMRCAPDMLRDGPMRLLDRLLSLPTSDGKGWNAQWHTCRELGWAGRHGYPSAAIAAVIAWADGLTRRRALDAEILSAVDDSDAVEFVARVAAESSDGLFGGTTAISTSDLERRALSPAAMLRLRDLWQSGFENDRVRRVAFGTWLTGAGWELRDVVVAACGDENLRDLAIQWRVKSGDESAAPLLIDQAQRQPFWWRLARHIWSPSVRTAVERAIVAMSDGDGDTASDLSELLYDIPSPDAESIVTRHQAIVRTSAAFVRAAAVVNTPRLRQFVAEAIASWEGSRDPFEFLGLALRAQQRKGTLSQSAFGALEPYLDRLSERALGSVGFAADDAGEMSWAERQIWSRIARPGAYVSGESGFLRELDDVHTNKDRFLSFDHVCDRYLRGGLLAPRLLELAFDWLRSHLDERGVALVAQVVTHLGGRDDVAELSVAARPLVSVGAVVRVLDNTKYQVERATLARNAQDRAMR